MLKLRKQDRSILVIENASSGDVPSVASLLSSAAEFGCERECWDDFVAERVERRGTRLIVPVAAPPGDGLKRLRQQLRTNASPIPVLAVVPREADSTFLQFASDIAHDFLLWPTSQLELHERIRRLIPGTTCVAAETHRRLTNEAGLNQLIGNDKAFLDVIDSLPVIAASELPVLVTGETGTGKEMIARAIHLLSPRSSGPFIPVDCTTIPDHLVESELFGHVRGAFTDAYRDQKGLAALADGGTIFLDEIDALSHASQAKLLRLLQEGTYRVLGSARFERANVRIIAASNQDLEVCVGEKRFRSDLYFRLNVIALHMPPLRERRYDILPLAQHFLDLSSFKTGATKKFLSPATAKILESYSWPGNIRELSNVVQRAYVLSPTQQILPSHIKLLDVNDPSDNALRSFREARAAALAAFEREYVSQMLNRHGGNVTHAARDAGKERRAFGRLVKKYQRGNEVA